MSAGWLSGSTCVAPITRSPATELDERRLAERIDLRRAHHALAATELDERRLAERIDLRTGAAPGS